MFTHLSSTLIMDSWFDITMYSFQPLLSYEHKMANMCVFDCHYICEISPAVVKKKKNPAYAGAEPTPQSLIHHLIRFDRLGVQKEREGDEKGVERLA